MLSYKLEKDVVLYKVQFDKMMLELFNGNYVLDRVSMDLDALLFRIKYMLKHNKDLSELPKLKQEFVDGALQLRSIFGDFIYWFLVDIIELPDYCQVAEVGQESFPFVDDILTQDVEIDTVYVRFKMIMISRVKKYLEYIDEKIEDGKVYNMYPNEYFRFFTDSYNDGIAKAYPELFEKHHTDEIGTGKDGDIFVHNFTFQTTERCSLNCTYCLGGDTNITMDDFSSKPIKYIEVGDYVLGCKESVGYGEYNRFFPTKVTALFHHREKCYKIVVDPLVVYGGKASVTYITGNHPVLTVNRGWVPVKDIDDEKDEIIMLGQIYTPNDVGWDVQYGPFPVRLTTAYYEIDEDDVERDVYNFETEAHTYIANKIVVHNCYQFNKSNMRMDFDTAKKFIDNLLVDKYGYINRYNSPAIIIEFIGGEPLLEINLTRKIYEYFLDRCYELNHPWFALHRLSICSNGLMYFDEDVQSFFKDYASNISFNISIDGNKELHDACRVQPNGEGSYDVDMIALNHYNEHYTPERNSKMTLAPANISYLYDSVVDFIKHDMTCININCVFEEGWNQETAETEYYQLKKLADYLIENNLEHLYIAIFNERQEDMQSRYSDGPFCGGSGSMLALRPNGQFYPCIRYMPTSVGDNVKDLCIGDIDNGITGREQGSEVLKMLDNITRRSMSNDICYECPISNDCSNCTALGHTVFGTPNKRTTFTCIQFIAEALANVYYWNKLLLKHPEYDLPVRKNNVPDEWALLVIDKDELDELKLLECYAMTCKLGRITNQLD